MEDNLYPLNTIIECAVTPFTFVGNCSEGSFIFALFEKMHQLSIFNESTFFIYGVTVP